MAQNEKKRNPLGSIFERTIIRHGKKVKVFDVRKRYRDADGKYKARTKRTYSYAEALAVLGNLPALIADKKTADSDGHSFGELLDYFESEYCRPAIFSGETQISGYRQRVSGIVAYLGEYREFFGTDTALKHLTYESIRQYSRHVATTPVRPGKGHKPTSRLPSPATVNRKLAYLRRVLNVGKQLRWISSNPFGEGPALIKISKEQPRTRILTFEEESRLLAACEEPDIIEYKRGAKQVKYETDNWRPHLRLILILAIDTGLRKKELFSLKRREIDLDNCLITLSTRNTKSLRSRSIVISERLDAELRRYFDQVAFLPNAEIFLGQKDADRAFATACRRAGIADLHFHDLRHTATTWMDEAGITQPAKQNMVGHSSKRTHQRYHNLSSDIVVSIREKMRDFERRRQASLG